MHVPPEVTSTRGYPDHPRHAGFFHGDLLGGWVAKLGYHLLKKQWGSLGTMKRLPPIYMPRYLKEFSLSVGGGMLNPTLVHFQ